MARKDAGAIARHLGTVAGRAHCNQLGSMNRLAWAGRVVDGIGIERHRLFGVVARLLSHCPA